MSTAPLTPEQTKRLDAFLRGIRPDKRRWPTEPHEWQDLLALHNEGVDLNIAHGKLVTSPVFKRLMRGIHRTGYLPTEQRLKPLRLLMELTRGKAMRADNPEWMLSSISFAALRNERHKGDRFHVGLAEIFLESQTQLPPQPWSHSWGPMVRIAAIYGDANLLERLYQAARPEAKLPGGAFWMVLDQIQDEALDWLFAHHGAALASPMPASWYGEGKIGDATLADYLSRSNPVFVDRWQTYQRQQALDAALPTAPRERGPRF